MPELVASAGLIGVLATGLVFAIALLIFPKVFRYARNLFVDAYTQPHVLTARARGLGRRR